MRNTPNVCSACNFDRRPIVIHHSQKGALLFGILVVGFIVGIVAMLCYLKNENPYSTTPIPIIVGFSVISLAALHILKHLLRDAGNVALTIGAEGVKFDRYPLIKWQDIEDVYVVEDSDSPDSLWLSVKEDVTFLPDGPRPLIWLATLSGLHRSIDITGYGSLTMPDKDIRILLEKGLHDFGESRDSE